MRFRFRAVGVLVLALIGLMTWAVAPAPSLPEGTRADRVVVRKAERVLELHRDGEVIRAYPISLGFSPEGDKLQEGDGRTPEGTYVIDEHLRESVAHRALHISYPDATDRAESAAAGVAPGGRIMIHGMMNGWGWLGRLHLTRDWTAGCIAVTDAHVREIWSAVPDGTPIEIRP